MKLLDLFKSKKPKQPTYEDRIERLIKLGCNNETINHFKRDWIEPNSLDCAIIFIIMSNKLANDIEKLDRLITSAYKNKQTDKHKNSVQFHALQIVEAFKKLK